MSRTAIVMVTERKAGLEATERLVREFRGCYSAGAVISEVMVCRATLLRAGVRSGLAEATEAMARCRLSNRLGVSQQ
ncbi:hypothetical protein [Georgenia sp. SYP-B2076]|uniref:hypothetical protein n=1 Tax=Georgenia sp. SYP-B2076 TaxID=2495881 RepID=UPI000F8CEE79|nr:hypothetical protein [Georgenia sp. SYP-B2076]